MNGKWVPGTSKKTKSVEHSIELPVSGNEGFSAVLESIAQGADRPVVYAVLTVNYGLEGDVGSNLQYEARDELLETFKRRVRTNERGNIPDRRRGYNGPDNAMAIEQVLGSTTESGIAIYGVILGNADKPVAEKIMERLRSELEFRVTDGRSYVGAFQLDYKIHSYTPSKIVEKAS